MPTLAGKVTQNFWWHEAECHSDPPVPVPDVYHNNVRAVCRELERVRHLCGNKPLTVTRIYSTSAHNAHVGGAPGSQHLLANAADILPPIEGMTTQELGRVVQVLASEPESRIRYIKVYPGHVHFDLRQRKALLTEGF